MRFDPDVQRAVGAYQLGLPHAPVAGRSGELLGRGNGSSLEFQEYREYMPGDDIRHLDWGAFARSDTLMVRLYREEISPRTEILVDASASMSTGQGAKTLLAKQLAAVFALLSGELGGRPGIIPLVDEAPLRSLGIDGLEALETMPFEARGDLGEMLARNHIPLQKQSLRIVISDFLFRHDPAQLIRRLAGDASALWVLQVLNQWEANPTSLGGRRLTDVETSGELDVIINKQTVADYMRRLGALQEELMRNCRRVHATFVPLVAERGLAVCCREDLLQTGILRAE